MENVETVLNGGLFDSFIAPSVIEMLLALSTMTYVFHNFRNLLFVLVSLLKGIFYNNVRPKENILNVNTKTTNSIVF